MTNPLSEQAAGAVLDHIASTQAQDHGWRKAFSLRHVFPRRHLSETTRHDMRFVTVEVLEDICRQRGVSLADLLASGLIYTRLDNREDTVPTESEATALIAQTNEGLHGLRVEAAPNIPQDAMHQYPEYHNSIIVNVAGFKQGELPIQDKRVQDDLIMFEVNDGLFIDLSRLRELAGRSEAIEPMQRVR